MTITTQAIIHSDLISHGLCSVTAIFPNILSLCCDIKWASISPLKLMLFIMLRVEHWNKPNGWMSNVHLNFNHANYVGGVMLLMAFRAFKFSCGRTKKSQRKTWIVDVGHPKFWKHPSNARQSINDSDHIKWKLFSSFDIFARATNTNT